MRKTYPLLPFGCEGQGRKCASRKIEGKSKEGAASLWKNSLFWAELRHELAENKSYEMFQIGKARGVLLGMASKALIVLGSPSTEELRQWARLGARGNSSKRSATGSG